jgi:hypothetical protein
MTSSMLPTKYNVQDVQLTHGAPARTGDGKRLICSCCGELFGTPFGCQLTLPSLTKGMLLVGKTDTSAAATMIQMDNSCGEVCRTGDLLVAIAEIEQQQEQSKAAVCLKMMLARTFWHQVASIKVDDDIKQEEEDEAKKLECKQTPCQAAQKLKVFLGTSTRACWVLGTVLGVSQDQKILSIAFQPRRVLEPNDTKSSSSSSKQATGESADTKSVLILRAEDPRVHHHQAL